MGWDRHEHRLTSTLSVRCPHCGVDDVAADPESTHVIAWFTCPRCGHDWSARLRNGRPDVETVIDRLHPTMIRALSEVHDDAA